MLLFFSILLYLILGVFAGLAGSLLGIGGGIIIVPSLLFLFSLMNFPADSLMHIAIATSLSSMVLNTFSSSYFHHKKGSIQWSIIRKVFLGILMGSFVGIFVAESLSTSLLEVFFGVFACLIGFIFVKPIKTEINKKKMPEFQTFTLIGFGVACLANLLGIGGGMFMIPIFLYYQLTEKKAIGTSSVISCLISLIGALGYIFITNVQLPIPGCYGYLYMPAFLAISISGTITSFYGVRLAHSLSPKTLRKIFSTVMVAMGLLMVFT